MDGTGNIEERQIIVHVNVELPSRDIPTRNWEEGGEVGTWTIVENVAGKGKTCVKPRAAP